LIYPPSVVVNCGEIPAPAFGFRVGSSFTYNKVLAFDCNPGYKLVGTQYRRCQENGLWSGAAPACVGKQMIRVDLNGYIASAFYMQFTLAASLVIICQDMMVWGWLYKK
jgi:hypothetical protein